MPKSEAPQAGRSPVRALADADVREVLALNNASATETSWLDEAVLRSLVAMACRATCVGDQARGVGAFLIALDHYVPYENPNFSWFKARHRSFVYVDRIVTARAVRGRGYGRGLYEDLFAWARSASHARIGCEVNINPPNPTSDAFHEALGFREVGRAVVSGGRKIVRYLEAEP